MNWAMKFEYDGQEYLLPGFTKAEAVSLCGDLRGSGFAADLVDMLEPLRARLPAGCRVRTADGKEGNVVAQPRIGAAEVVGAHDMDHAGTGMVSVRLDGRPPAWFVADAIDLI
ncbi:hypothetical protein [Streptosporangium sp. NPDC051022]|uniref:hypothetical protein n=1 Tax=Streptosporangium sp. NPDC051022 TaxID=3155752 RepID=UPI003420819B